MTRQQRCGIMYLRLTTNKGYKMIHTIKEVIETIIDNTIIEFLIALCNARIENIENDIKDWASRIYKITSKKIQVGTWEEQGDTPWQPGVKNFNAKVLNDRKRNNRIKAFKEDIVDIRHEIQQLINLKNNVNFGNKVKDSIAMRKVFENFGGTNIKEYWELIGELNATIEVEKIVKTKSEDEIYKEFLNRYGKDFDPLEILLEA